MSAKKIQIETRFVKIVELPDRYLIVDWDSGDIPSDLDRFGFSDEISAREYCDRMYWEVVE
jgi:hypothetical protein